MSKKCKSIVYSCIIIIIAVLILLMYKAIGYSGLFNPYLSLNDHKTIVCEVNNPCVDPGARARYRFKDISKLLSIKNNIDFNKVGNYQITYQLSSFNKNITRSVEVVDSIPPKIKLKGEQINRIFAFSNWKDPGYQITDNYDHLKNIEVKINGKVNTSKIGTYNISYEVFDSSNNKASINRQVRVYPDPTKVKIKYAHDTYSNTATQWWFNKSKDHQIMAGSLGNDILKKYDSYYVGENAKVIYLTFDEGGNDITYIKEIANVLKQNNVQATYFLTRNYIKNEAAFMNQLVNDKNVIGNHTWHHYNMATLANVGGIDQFVSEISETEKTYTEVTGRIMKKLFRFPKGEASERGMKLVKDLGYKNFFWSHAYYDFGSDVSEQDAYKTLIDHYHNGAIYLLHPSNRGNYEAMNAFIKQMKKQGYRFDTLDKIK